MRKSYSEYLAETFSSRKVQKISVNLNLGCPNRDGTIAKGGCIYCNNEAFSPKYCHESKDITTQINKGKEFFSKKYKDMEYVVYFQNYTGSYSSLPALEKIYREALAQERVVGLVIGTRPDCAPDPFLDMVASLPLPAIIEYGAETSHNRTLDITNRHHTWQCTVDAVKRTAAKNIRCGFHLINGLPGESVSDMIETAKSTSQLPVDSIKFHHLQVLKGTTLANSLSTLPPIFNFSPESYLDLCVEINKIVPESIVIERFLAQSPPEMVISPKWNMKNYQFANLLHSRLIDNC